MTATVPKPRTRLTFVVLAVGVGAYALLQSLVTPVLPTIERALHTNQTDVTWVLTAYLLSASIFTPILGRLGDMRGKKQMFVLGLVALAIGSLIAALASSLAVMIVARVIQGIGGGVLPLAFGIIRDEFAEEDVPGAVSLIASLTAVGAGLGIVLAGPIVAVLSYHWLFWIPLIMIGLAAIGALLFVHDSGQRSAGRINWLTAALLSAWLIALLIAVSEAPSWGWGSIPEIGLLAAAVVLVAVWVLTEARSSHPLIDMRMMANRAVWTTNLVAFLFGIAMYSLFAFLPQFLQTPTSAGYGFGASTTESGVMILPQAAAMFLLGLVAGRLAQRFGSKRLLILGSSLGVAALLVLAFAHDEKWQIYLVTTITGIGFGLAFSSMSNLIVGAVPQHQTGVASGMNANIRTIGGSLGAAVMASIVTADPTSSGLPREAGYTGGFLLLAGAMLLSTVAAFLVPTITRRKDGRHDEEPSTALRHAELALVPGGTLVGDDSE